MVANRGCWAGCVRQESWSVDQQWTQHSKMSTRWPWVIDWLHTLEPRGSRIYTGKTRRRATWAFPYFRAWYMLQTARKTVPPWAAQGRWLGAQSWCCRLPPKSQTSSGELQHSWCDVESESYGTQWNIQGVWPCKLPIDSLPLHLLAKSPELTLDLSKQTRRNFSNTVQG